MMIQLLAPVSICYSHIKRPSVQCGTGGWEQHVVSRGEGFDVLGSRLVDASTRFIKLLMCRLDWHSTHFGLGDESGVEFWQLGHDQ